MQNLASDQVAIAHVYPPAGYAIAAAGATKAVAIPTTPEHTTVLMYTVNINPDWPDSSGWVDTITTHPSPNLVLCGAAYNDSLFYTHDSGIVYRITSSQKRARQVAVPEAAKCLAIVALSQNACILHTFGADTGETFVVNFASLTYACIDAYTNRYICGLPRHITTTSRGSILFLRRVTEDGRDAFHAVAFKNNYIDPDQSCALLPKIPPPLFPGEPVQTYMFVRTPTLPDRVIPIVVYQTHAVIRISDEYIWNFPGLQGRCSIAFFNDVLYLADAHRLYRMSIHGTCLHCALNPNADSADIFNVAPNKYFTVVHHTYPQP